MLSHLSRWFWIFASPLVLFLVLWLINHLIYYYFFRHKKLSLEAPTALMALSMTSLALWPAVNPHPIIMNLIAMEFLVLWLYLGMKFVSDNIFQTVSAKIKPDHISIGIWVGATLLPTLLFVEIEPTLYGLIIFFAMTAIILWILYCYFCIKWLNKWIHKKYALRIDARLLFASINTSFLALMTYQLLNQELSFLIYELLLILAGFAYGISLYAMLIQALRFHKHHLLMHLNANITLFYSAIAILGLAVINTGMPQAMVEMLWWAMIISLIIIESLAFLKAAFRMKKHGLVTILLFHDQSQWLRIFSWAACYAFFRAYQFPYDAHHVPALIPLTSLMMIMLLIFYQLLLLVFHRNHHSYQLKFK